MRFLNLRDLPGWWPYALGALVLAVQLVATGHVVLRKRDVSWQKIGEALGVSRQAAWERFG